MMMMMKENIKDELNDANVMKPDDDGDGKPLYQSGG